MRRKLIEVEGEAPKECAEAIALIGALYGIERRASTGPPEERARLRRDESQAIDNNGTERCLRGVVIGRRNHYGSRSQRGTEVAALFYSLIESAKFAGVGPQTYLRAATLAALRGAAVLLPHQLA